MLEIAKIKNRHRLSTHAQRCVLGDDSGFPVSKVRLKTFGSFILLLPDGFFQKTDIIYNWGVGVMSIMTQTFIAISRFDFLVRRRKFSGTMEDVA